LFYIYTSYPQSLAAAGFVLVGSYGIFMRDILLAVFVWIITATADEMCDIIKDNYEFYKDIQL